MACIDPRTIIASDGNEYKVPCGKCILCRNKRVKDWTIKLINESKYYKKCCMITLTFDNKEITNPSNRTYKYIPIIKYVDKNGEIKTKKEDTVPYIWDIHASKKYFQNFMKRLRKQLYPTKIKYFKVGEYGEKGTKRPHYHLILLGTNFDFDRKEVEKSKKGKTQYQSETLDNAWSIGRTRITELNSHSIAYTVGYCLKKARYTLNKEIYTKNVRQVEKTKTKIDFYGNKIKTTYKEWEYSYKPIQSFSNRAKFNAKWIRKYPEKLEKDFLKDEDGKMYSIPKSYLNNLKNSDNLEHQYYYTRYVERIEQYFENVDKNAEKMRLLNKAKILESQLKNIKRDFN